MIESSRWALHGWNTPRACMCMLMASTLCTAKHCSQAQNKDEFLRPVTRLSEPKYPDQDSAAAVAPLDIHQQFQLFPLWGIWEGWQCLLA